MRLSRRDFLMGVSGGAALLASSQFSFAADTGEFRIGFIIPSDWESLRYPSQISWQAWANLVSMRLEPLVRMAGENNVEYVLAERIYDNGTGDVWYVELKPNAFWNGLNGPEPFTLQQVEANIQHWIDDPKSQIGAEFRPKVRSMGIEALSSGKERLRIELKQSDYQFFYAFTSYAAMFAHPGDGWVFTPQSRGTGPFQVASFTANREMRFAPEGTYWDPTKRAIYPVVFVQDSEATSEMYDFIPEISPGRWKALSQQGLKVKQNPLADTLGFHMDCRSNLFRDPSLGQALRFCMNPQAMVDSISGFGRLADHTHAASIQQDFPSRWSEKSMYNPDRARQLLGGRNISLPLFYRGKFEWQKNLVEAYKAEADKVGIHIETVPCGDEFDKQWDKYEGGLTAIKWQHRPLAMQLYRKVYTTGAEWNLSNWSNVKFDRLVKSFFSTPLTEPDKAQGYVDGAMRLLQDEGPMVQAVWFDCNKGYNPERVLLSSVQVGSGGHIYAEKLRRAI